MTYKYYPNELYHFGIKGQKWGVRRFQNEDGTLTAEGKKRYGVSTGKEWVKLKDEMNKKAQTLRKKRLKSLGYNRLEDEYSNRLNAIESEYDKYSINGITDEDVLTYNKAMRGSLSAERSKIIDEYDAKIEETIKSANEHVSKVMKQYYGKSYEVMLEDDRLFLDRMQGMATVGALTGGAIGTLLWHPISGLTVGYIAGIAGSAAAEKYFTIKG